MVNRETLQGMIQLSTSSIFANGVKPNGLAGTALPEGAEAVDFAALLGAAGLAVEAPQAGPVHLTAAVTTASIALQDGKTGKPAGKTLPVEEAAIAAPQISDNLETNEAPDEAISDQADVPIAAAIPVLPLIVPPLPGNGNSAELRAAVPDSLPSRPLVLAAATRPQTSTQHIMVAAAKLSPPRGSTEATPPAGTPRPAGPIAAAGVIPETVLSVKLAPVVTLAAQPQTSAAQQAPVNSTVPGPVTATTAPIVVTDMQPAMRDTTAATHAAETKPAAHAEPSAVYTTATSDVQSKAIPTAAIPVQGKAAPLAPAIAVENSTPFEGETHGENREAPVRVETQISASPRSAISTARAPAEPAAAPGQPLRPEAVSAPPPSPAPIDRSAVSATQSAPPAIAANVEPVAENRKQEPQIQAAAEPVTELFGEARAEADHTVQTARPSTQFSPLASAPQEAPASRPATAPVSATPAAGSSEQPHDFATLVDRLSEAREAASPQVVRTALHHADFGRVSLQFRHDDGNLSVTMANADPAFTSAVHNAVAASASGSAAGNGDQPRQEGQQGQQQQSATQQQAATSGNGQGQAQQQAAQARAEQGERNSHRAQGSPTDPQQERGASSARSEAGTRRSGIYA